MNVFEDDRRSTPLSCPVIATTLAVIDGGGSGTRARLYDAKTRLLIGEGVAGPSSLTLGVASAWENIQIAIHAASQQHQLQQSSTSAAHTISPLPSHIIAGLAGSRNRVLNQALQQLVADASSDSSPSTITIVSDAYTSALGAHAGQPGLTIAIGTGLAACRIDHRYRPYYTSGWGFKVGDEGAGSWIGLQAVQSYLKHLDGRSVRPSELHEGIASVVGRQAMDIQQWTRLASATDFAVLAKQVVDTADNGDDLAQEIVDGAVAEIVLAIQAIEDPDTALPIALLGGLASAISRYLPQPIADRLVAPRGSSLDGAALILFGDCPAEPQEE